MADTETKELDKPIYSIGSVARLLNVSVQTLRFYEREGLIIPQKSKGNQRQYSDADIDRINCIRRAIREEKISVAGIKRIQALIPCWDIVQCSEADRSRCKSVSSHLGACWSHAHTKDACARRDCRQCEVYKTAMDCEQIKRHIVNIGRHRSFVADPEKRKGELA